MAPWAIDLGGRVWSHERGGSAENEGSVKGLEGQREDMYPWIFRIWYILLHSYQACYSNLPSSRRCLSLQTSPNFSLQPLSSAPAAAPGVTITFYSIPNNNLPARSPRVGAARWAFTRPARARTTDRWLTFATRSKEQPRLRACGFSMG